MYTNSSRSYLKMASGTPRRTNGTPWRTGGTPTAEYSDQKIEELPPEEQEAAEMKLMATADALVDTIDTAYRVTEKACDSIIDSLDELEKWIDKW